MFNSFTYNFSVKIFHTVTLIKLFMNHLRTIRRTWCPEAVTWWTHVLSRCLWNHRHTKELLYFFHKRYFDERIFLCTRSFFCCTGSLTPPLLESASWKMSFVVVWIRECRPVWSARQFFSLHQKRQAWDTWICAAEGTVMSCILGNICAISHRKISPEWALWFNLCHLTQLVYLLTNLISSCQSPWIRTRALLCFAAFLWFPEAETFSFGRFQLHSENRFHPPPVVAEDARAPESHL